MQRISAVYAKPGMVIECPVYDYWGDIVLEKGTALDAKDIVTVNDTGIGELFISNQYAEDIQLKPIISPELSGALSKALRRIIIEARTILTSKSQTTIDISSLEQVIEELIIQLAATKITDISINGCFSLKDYNYVHPVKTATIALLIGKAIGMNDDDLRNLGQATLLQNIGYVLIPQGILEKPGPLNEGEIITVKKHPLYGTEILHRYTTVKQEVIDIIYQHHERWNGSGYPLQLKQNELCTSAQIIGIVDTCFALASKRPHREEFLPVFAIEHSIVSPHEAIEFILAYSGELFNPDMVRVFASLVPVYPAGVRIKLNNGQEGIVCNTSTGIWRRPQVRIFKKLNKPVSVAAKETNVIKESQAEDNQAQDKTEKFLNLDLAKKIRRHTFIVETFDY